MLTLGTKARRTLVMLHTHGEWVCAAVALVVAASVTFGTDPEASPDVYIAGTFGTAAAVIGVFTVWLARGDRVEDRRAWWVGLLGVPVAVLIATLPNLLAGDLADDRTGTGASIGLFALVLAACIPGGPLLGFLVLLPAGLLVRGLLMAATGRGEGVLLALFAGFPLAVIAAGVAGAMAMDQVPITTGPWNLIGAGGAAMLFRAFGVDNGVRIVDETDLLWFRVLTILVATYVVTFCAAGLSRPRQSEVASRPGAAAVS